MGPIAPKDPVTKREAFYIMYEKQIFASPVADGKGTCFLYMNDGRMINSSKLIGNITDEEIHTLLKTVAGFKKLVFGIGVSMINNSGDNADFVFQMYGHTDMYTSGTTIRQPITSDGVEYLIPLNEIDWSDDDNEPGQIRFEFAKPEVTSFVSVKFYLNDGYHAPAFEPCDPVDVTSEAYNNMLNASVLSIGNNTRLVSALEKAQKGEKITVSFIGGSITQGAGATPINSECYAYKVFKHINETYSKNKNAVFVKAGVGGTPSELGIVRFKKDVLKNKGYLDPSAQNIKKEEGLLNLPDIVVIEFAVNDAGDETNGECYEGLIRRCLKIKNKPAVILLFNVFADDYTLEDRMIPIGKHYGLPMISMRRAVTNQFYKSKDEGRILAKSQYFYDTYHPTSLGHSIISGCFEKLFTKTLDSKTELIKSSTEEIADPYFTSEFDNITMIDRVNQRLFLKNFNYGGFASIDKDIQCVEMNYDLVTTPEFPDNYMHIGDSSTSEPLSFETDCRLLMIVTKDSASSKTGKADVFVDGSLVKTINPLEIGWTHCNAQIIIRTENIAHHKVEIKMHPGDENKDFTILGFGL